MSVERETRKAIRWMTWWRCVTAFFGIFEDLFKALSNVVRVFEEFFAQLAKSTYALEMEHARKYFALTGLDPARADGDEDRYREVRIAAGAEKRIEDDDIDLEEEL
jgi:hypothetical protein